MAIQIINSILALVIVGQIIYLFTCGQEYMLKSAKYERFSYKVYQYFYIVVACGCLINTLLWSGQTLGMTFMYVTVNLFIAVRVRVVMKQVKRSLNISKKPNEVVH